MNNYETLDLNQIKELVLEYCAIDDSKTFILNEDVSFNPLIIRRNINETKEALNLLKNNFYLSFDGVVNLNDLFLKAKKNIILNPQEFSKILSFHNHCQRIKNGINKLEGDYFIKDYNDSIMVYDDLAINIEKAIDLNGNIKEDASKNLKDIINRINTNENKITSLSISFIKSNSQYLQENNTFFRDNRTTFLLKNTFKNKFNGYQYGQSSSGLAAYVEPEQFVELNNLRNTLNQEKEEEIKRILRELTYLLSKYSDSYLNNFESLMKLDIIFAKAKFGFYKNGIVGEINEDNSLYLKDIIHPLIDEKVAISNTYELNNDYLGIVISGTNTGGKTVGLKIMGLSCLMTYLGIPILALKASIPLFDNIFVDVDNNQSINNALSTFSAHITNINNILNNATNKSFVLIDELISGTDPKEAQAISLAIIDEILDIKCKFVITTHYDDIKQFAYNNPNILLSSVGFDLENLKPTYKYIEDSIGVSNAIKIADRYFDNQKIINKAYDYLNINKTKEDELIEKLNKEIDNNLKLQEGLNNEINNNKKLNDELNNRINDFENQKELLLKEYKESLDKKLKEIKKKAYKKLDKIKDNKIVSKKLINEIEELNEKEVKEKTIFKINDHVKIGESNQAGIVVDINNDIASIEINGMIIKTGVENLIKIEHIQKKEYKPKQRMEFVSSEINLVGKRVEEALYLLDDYLDNAYGYNLKTIKIIHGFGTGQLRKAIREHLSKNKTIKEFSNGDIYDGGSNVTIVKFK